MKRILLILALPLFVFSAISNATSDQNAMDEIGFDNAFGYYKSANETVNMQSGNVTLMIPVSPVFKGPQGSGLDIQLNMIYNSQFWRYKSVTSHMPDNPPSGCDRIDEPDLVDLDHMYFSAVGTGWTFHMGRLLKKVTPFGSDEEAADFCEAIQYFYEDPSGTLHEFGGYADQWHSEYRSVDGSDLTLKVHDTSGDEGSIELFFKSGKKVVFGPAFNLPILPNDCTGAIEPNVSPDSREKIYYAIAIHDYKSQNVVQLEYRYEDQSTPRYCQHQLTKIIDAFNREIIFNYEDRSLGIAVTVPCLSSISYKGFQDDETTPDDDIVYSFSYYVNDIYEPWGLAGCGDFEGDISLENQLFLSQITLPENMSHQFTYGSTGEIHSYTTPLNATTTYHFKDVITETEGGYFHEGCSNFTRKRIYMNPSRFLWKKELTANGNDYEWLYSMGTRPSVLERYDSEPVTIFYHNVYRGIKPVTGVIDPDGNEIRYHWIVKRFEGEDKDGKTYYFASPFSYRFTNGNLPSGTFPKEDNSKNGRMEKICYYQGLYSQSQIVKEEEFTYTDGGERGEYCHENDNIYRSNIRMESKTSRVFDFTGNYLTSSETYQYDDNGNVIKIISSAEGLPDIITDRVFKPICDYKSDFLEWEAVTCAGEVISIYKNIEHPEFPGKIGENHRYTDWSNNPEEDPKIITYFEYDQEDLWQLESQKTGDDPDDPIVKYEFVFGSLREKTVGGLIVESNDIDPHTGLIEVSRDGSGNRTSYSYDNLNRITYIDPPGSNRFPLVVRYTKPEYGLNIEYEKNGVDLQVHWIDAMGNHSTQQDLIYDNETVSYSIVKDVTFDWRNLALRSVYPGSNLGVRNVHDCLGRLVTAYEEKTDPPTITDVEYWIGSDNGIPGIRKKVAKAGIEKFYFSDLRGNLREVEGGAPSGVAEYDYDHLGNLTRVYQTDFAGDQEQQTRAFSYDLAGRMHTATEPETHNVPVTFEYYDDGKTKLSNTPKGSIKYLYDEHNRINCVESPIGNPIREYIYGDDKSTIVLADGHMFNIENGYGRLVSVIETQSDDLDFSGVVQTAFSYNEFGEVKDEAVCVNLSGGTPAPRTYITHYDYDEWGNLECIKYPVSETWIRYSNTFGDQVPEVTVPFVTGIEFYDPTYPDKIRTLVPGIDYNATGGLKRLDYENSLSLEIKTDIANRISEINSFNTIKTDDVYFSQDYVYDGLDRIVRMGIQEFDYYNDGSLKQFIDNDPKDSITVDYTYDAFGNMTNRIVDEYPHLSFSNYTYTNNHLNSNGEIIATYDSNGNVEQFNPYGTFGSPKLCFFSAENRMNSAVALPDLKVDFYYDGAGNRRMKRSRDEAELFFYDPSGNSLLEKLTFDLANNDEPKLLKDECYVNYKEKTVAQFDYLEPVTEIKFRDNRQSVFYPGDTFDLFLDYQYEGLRTLFKISCT